MEFHDYEQRIFLLLKYIDKNLHRPLDVNLLAEISGWSRWQLQRVFSAHTGLSVAQYVRQLRLAIAAWKLLNTSDRQLDIALFLRSALAVASNNTSVAHPEIIERLVS